MFERFAALHTGGAILLLPNAWDAASARIFEDAGFPAVATSSAGMAYSLGYADGEAMPPTEMIAAVARIVRVVDVPVSADIEAGYSADVARLRETVSAVRNTGAAGINLEDWNVETGAPFPLEVARARVAAAKDAARDEVFVNARTDIFLHSVGEPATRLSATLERLRAFVAAGADGVFVPGVSDATTIAALASAISAPLNVLAGAQTPPLAELEACGVARVSVGGWPMRRIMTATRELARNLLERRSFEALSDPGTLSYDDANALFSKSSRT